MRWEKIKKFLPIVGIGLFIYLLIRLNVTKIFQEIVKIKPHYFLIAIVFVLIFLFFQTLKWFVIAKKQGIDVPFGEAFKINLMSNFYGFVTPAKLGSIIRADYLSKYKGGIGRGLSNFVIDKILDLSSLFVLAIIFGIVFYNKIEIISKEILYILIAIFLILIVISSVFYKKSSSRLILKFVYRKFIPNKMKEKAKITFDSFYENMPSIFFLMLVLIFNVISWITNYCIFYFIGLSLGVNLGFIYFLGILPIATLVAQIPITISGLGTRELAMISLFGLFDIEAVKVFSMSLLTILIANIIPSIFAILLLLIKKKK
jgi:uncharacterized protein (TIRG00374 family)